MRYCIGLLHRPTADGRVLEWVELPTAPIKVLTGDWGDMIATARNFRVVRGELWCSIDRVVGSSEVITPTLGDVHVQGDDSGTILILGGSIESLSVHTGKIAWRQLNGRQRR